MSFITTTCPHCRAELVPLKVRNIYIRKNVYPVLLCACARCEEPVAAVLESGGRGGNFDRNWFLTNNAQVDIDLLEVTGWRIREIYPEPTRNSAPEHTPQAVSRIFIQGIDNQRRGNFDSAAIMFRKTLEVATKMLDPELKLPLQRRIEALADAKKIPKEVGEWAHEVRIVGNDAAHTSDEPNAGDVDAIAEFTEAFLEYVFTMPEKFRLRKSKEPATEEIDHSAAPR